MRNSWLRCPENRVGAVSTWCQAWGCTVQIGLAETINEVSFGGNGSRRFCAWEKRARLWVIVNVNQCTLSTQKSEIFGPKFTKKPNFTACSTVEHLALKPKQTLEISENTRNNLQQILLVLLIQSCYSETDNFNHSGGSKISRQFCVLTK